MSESWKRPTLIAAALLVLLVGWWISRSPQAREASVPTSERAAPAEPTAPAKLPRSTPIRSTRTNPVKAALRHSSWQIVARKENGSPGTEVGGTAKGSVAGPDNTDPSGTETTRLSLEFVRANFEAAGMRGVERFAAFSPPQFAAIKSALEKHPETSISTAPDEFAKDGESVYYELVNAEDNREFAAEFTPTPAADKQTLQLRIETGGSTRRRDTTLPIWDGQTVMIPLAQTPGARSRIALFITARLIGADGTPANDFMVKER
ncbi:MAG: hypothetical protein ACR2RV_25055 [Verrucomicrobiales bacterium]